MKVHILFYAIFATTLYASDPKIPKVVPYKELTKIRQSDETLNILNEKEKEQRKREITIYVNKPLPSNLVERKK